MMLVDGAGILKAFVLGKQFLPVGSQAQARLILEVMIVQILADTLQIEFDVTAIV